MMSNKVDEAFYNTLESPQRQPQKISHDSTVTVNDYDYSDVTEPSYEKLNPAGAIPKNMYSSLTGSPTGKGQIPQDYLTPVMSENLKEHYNLSDTTSPAVIDKNKSKDITKKKQGKFFWLLLLLTSVSLLVAIVAVILAILALSKTSTSTDNHPSVSKDHSATKLTTEEFKDQTNDTSAIQLDSKLLQFYINITTQLTELMSSISNVESVGNAQYDELEIIKGVYLLTT